MSEPREPFKDSKDGWEPVTVGELIKMLSQFPNDYEVMYDGFCGEIRKRDFTVSDDSKAISLNG